MTFQLEQSIFTEEKSYKFVFLFKLCDKNLWKALFLQTQNLRLASFENELSYNFRNSV